MGVCYLAYNYVPLLADIFLYSYEAEFIQSLLLTEKKKITSQFNFSHTDSSMTYCQSITQNLRSDWVKCIPLSLRSNTRLRAIPLLSTWVYSCQSRVTVSCALSLYDKRDDFNFHITNFPFLNSNIPSSQAYGVFIWLLIRYARACSSYECFILRAVRLSSKLLRQGYVMERLKSPLRKFYGWYGDIIKHFEVSLSQMLHDIPGHDHVQCHPQLIRYYTNLRTYYRSGLYYRFWPYYQILEVSIEHCNGCG